MTIVNVMWSGGQAFSSVHTVHRQVLAAVEEATIVNWLLEGDAVCCGEALGPVRAFHLPHRLLKGRHLWRVLLLAFGFYLRRTLRQCGARLVLLDGIGVARVMLPALRRMPELRAVVIFHGTTRLRRSDIRLLTDFPDARLDLMAVSRVLAESLEQVLGRPIGVLRAPLEPDRFRKELLARDEARQELGLQSSWTVLGAVGRLVPEKGFDCLIEAFAAHARRYPDAYLVILGEGDQREQLAQLIAGHGLESRVLLAGYRSDAARLYRAFDWACIPSHDEGLGLVLQEAVLAGVPLLCSDLPVFREQLGDAGLYAPVADIAAWSERINHCLAQGGGGDIASKQMLALMPEHHWASFDEACRRLLTAR